MAQRNWIRSFNNHTVRPRYGYESSTADLNRNGNDVQTKGDLVIRGLKNPKQGVTVSDADGKLLAKIDYQHGSRAGFVINSCSLPSTKGIVFGSSDEAIRFLERRREDEKEAKKLDPGITDGLRAQVVEIAVGRNGDGASGNDSISGIIAQSKDAAATALDAVDSSSPDEATGGGKQDKDKPAEVSQKPHGKEIKTANGHTLTVMPLKNKGEWCVVSPDEKTQFVLKRVQNERGDEKIAIFGPNADSEELGREDNPAAAHVFCGRRYDGTMPQLAFSEKKVRDSEQVGETKRTIDVRGKTYDVTAEEVLDASGEKRWSVSTLKNTKNGRHAVKYLIITERARGNFQITPYGDHPNNLLKRHCDDLGNFGQNFEGAITAAREILEHFTEDTSDGIPIGKSSRERWGY
ncbi:hypothetical protein HZA38_05390 [Candidatus Peregrinibacteria bacterium]|nr:hypothetical protein [Candidatus Peregrinibacteria bacterium]